MSDKEKKHADKKVAAVNAKKAAGNKDGRREKLSAKEYDKALEKLHVELVKLQEWVKFKGLRAMIVFEGRDGAGKGGAIKAITERVSPRVFRVVALPTPTERQKSQMYLQRYMEHFPAAGEIVIWDRSWYNRAGVERVMGFCPEERVKRFLELAPMMEKLIIESGIILIKYWLEVSMEEQTRRIEGRIHDGRKIWKLSPMDVQSYNHWYDYSRARDEMFKAQPDFPPADADSLQESAARKSRIAETREGARLCRTGLSVQVRARKVLNRHPRRSTVYERRWQTADFDQSQDSGLICD